MGNRHWMCSTSNNVLQLVHKPSILVISKPISNYYTLYIKFISQKATFMVAFCCVNMNFICIVLTYKKINRKISIIINYSNKSKKILSVLEGINSVLEEV